MRLSRRRTPSVSPGTGPPPGRGPGAWFRRHTSESAAAAESTATAAHSDLPGQTTGYPASNPITSVYGTVLGGPIRPCVVCVRPPGRLRPAGRTPHPVTVRR
eukprot:754735-Hanusia_phi.AAC.3